MKKNARQENEKLKHDHLYDEKAREFCLTSGIEILSTNFVRVLDLHRREKK